jgi:23S rRNA (pseudouridine1915-N3)-methyltransferase
MRIWIAAIGGRPREAFDDLARLYRERMAALVPGAGGRSGVEMPVYRTEQALWEAVERERARTTPLVVLLDERGRAMASAEFAQWLGRERDEGRQLILFAVGPADGWSQPSRGAGVHRRENDKGPARAPAGAMQLSLGPMTLAHELARVVLCEQVYRALTILQGHPYHREG